MKSFEEPPAKKTPTPPKYKPGPKSKQKTLNPWMDEGRQSPDSGAAVSSSWDSKRKSLVDLSDSDVSHFSLELYLISNILCSSFNMSLAEIYTFRTMVLLPQALHLGR